MRETYRSASQRYENRCQKSKFDQNIDIPKFVKGHWRVKKVKASEDYE